jgi:hypothetical protein
MATKRLLNSTNLDITMALWLATDTYDHFPEDAPDDDTPIISVTQLLKPTKALVLAQRIPPEEAEVEITDLMAARLGQSIHAAIEHAYKNHNMDLVLRSLGFPASLVDRIIVNPTKEALEKKQNPFPIYLEKRAYRKIKTTAGTEVWISGKFDQVVNGKPEDNKSTKVYSYTKMDQSESGDYALQMGMYKWLNPEIITSDMGQINFILTDWNRRDAGRDGYPPKSVLSMPVSLMDPADAEKFIRTKLDEIEQNAELPEADIVRCKDEELWRSDDVHKYYADPETAARNGRATKNFDSYAEAQNYRTTKGKGVVKTVPGEVKRCGYCEAAPLCIQRLEYVEQ